MTDTEKSKILQPYIIGGIWLMRILNWINVSISQWAVPGLSFNNLLVPESLAEELLLCHMYWINHCCHSIWDLAKTVRYTVKIQLSSGWLITAALSLPECTDFARLKKRNNLVYRVGVAPTPTWYQSLSIKRKKQEKKVLNDVNLIIHTFQYGNFKICFFALI